MLTFEGSSLFRHHIVCSILTSKPIRILGIHDDDEPQGIQLAEANFLKFIDRVTSGSKFECTDSNTALTFYPGMILGGTFSHEVPSCRCVTYIAEAALLLLPFAKFDTRLTLVGSTQSEEDLSVDTLRTVTTRWLQLFGVDCSVRIIRRGVYPGGGGAIEVQCKAVRRLTAAEAVVRGRVRRIRGISFGARVAADLVQRAATAAKGVLLNLLPDVYVVTDMDNSKGSYGDRSSGYGVVLVAETTSKQCVISQESTAAPKELPEDVGKRAAELLLDQVFECGCVDAHHQMLVLLLMGLSPDEVSTVRFGQFTCGLVSAVMLLEMYFGVSCATKQEWSSVGKDLPPTTLITCVGSNMVNVWKKSG
ncbi:RNA re-capping enzyme, cytoplasmic [Trypanosoma equiperdum]|uniref:RNA 3'-terminal phosphate cyclase-like protein n=4 Tax=Trypanozoon TaxID=39700 RepID=Q38D23_TRYB2|nr:RNA 3'-terminal phosphate cyclase-like protein,putative [Trypanosoma brucei gambiense DAL972]XP_827627.1 RNA 3'-terminal phosphate cyclase-like protein [Trypanosoma brucei brucei TREU927]RHW70099.1 RNA re-capping enzyme [Trypanosoma brucei equiperdum]SCU71048.1 RNA re-capping enzyme, cytoplasmic [Trypanosoma equiperdum]EAN77297.1 RNA 3'-terminal phosphate cyclase-like protein [Trypanosoma brucei brucei TREU927]CBH14829.1 RNA 3'-terminal phosphate cyclase-like protein,putative [Trypanosoma b|eukprot:XP_011777095.1 RNA 3'-terminal phosphate cyclase-like protein,putative [Trypanosoma brucei gambiense DAL972]